MHYRKSKRLLCRQKPLVQVFVLHLAGCPVIEHIGHVPQHRTHAAAPCCPSHRGQEQLHRLLLLVSDDAAILADDDGHALVCESFLQLVHIALQHTLFPWLSIYDNIAFGLRARGIYKQEKDRVDEFIEMVGLKGFEHSYPHQLSGGMCQRASLARALVGRPKVLLLDEPLGALDAFTRMNMQDEILRIWKETGMTAIMVTHDVDEAVYLSDKVVVMTPRPGRITGTLDIQLSRPRARSSEDFLQYRGEILRRLHYGGKVEEPNYYI